VVNTNPLTAKTPKEVPLENAPLVRVIAQVRFPTILSIEKKDFVGSFQEAIREKYPILQPEKTQGFVLTPQGVMAADPQMIWRFADAEGNWQISLVSGSISLSTVTYSNRNDFLERLEDVLEALETYIKPQVIERFGLRYINRLANSEIADLQKLLRPEIAGIVGLEVGENLIQSINESLFNLPDRKEQITARWGLIPANTTIDPTAIEPINESSWILDLDMSLSTQRVFSVEGVVSEARQFSERIYTFFRWVVNDNFLRRFGGEP
jgi:uncharacterized protein (TIGR04255 family)